MIGESATSALEAAGCCFCFSISPADCGAWFNPGCGFSSVALKVWDMIDLDTLM